MKRFFALSLALLSLVTLVHAESAPIPMPGDTRLFQFVYNPNDTYTVLTRPFSSTHIEMASDEELDMVVMGDTVQWIVGKTPKHLFIKPVRPDIFTSATLITTKRSYQLTFRASPENGKWMQRVNWHYPELEMIQRVESDAKTKRSLEAKATDEALTPVTGLAPEKMGFDYQIDGTASFKPATVFDDGKFLYIRFASGNQEMPALFLVDADGSLSLVNFVVKGDLVVVQRLATRLLLKLGKDEIRITKRGAEPAKSGWFSMFGSKR